MSWVVVFVVASSSLEQEQEQMEARAVFGAAVVLFLVAQVEVHNSSVEVGKM